MRVFVTGLYAIGKTTLAKTMAAERGLKYVSFDAIHRYGSTTARQVLGRIPSDGFVCDAIPFDRVPLVRRTLYEEFERYCETREVELVVKLADRAVWSSRPKPSRTVTKGDWSAYHLSNLPDALQARATKRFFSDSGEIARAEALKLLDYKDLILERAQETQNYDWKYQAVPELGVHGYSGSHKTWVGLQPALAPMGDLAGKVFVDAGSNHGYFCFRLEELGAKCVGLDDHDGVLFTAKGIAFLKESSVRFLGWNAKKDSFPAANCTMILNALHHFGHECLARVRSEWLLLESYPKDVAAAEGLFEVVYRGGSHRRDREIVLMRRRP